MNGAKKSNVKATKSTGGGTKKTGHCNQNGGAKRDGPKKTTAGRKTASPKKPHANKPSNRKGAKEAKKDAKDKNDDGEDNVQRRRKIVADPAQSEENQGRN